MKPLPDSPKKSEVAEAKSRNRLSIVDASDETNQTFTTSIYLNQTPPATPQVGKEGTTEKPTSAAATSSS